MRITLRVAHTCTTNLGSKFQIFLSYKSLKYMIPIIRNKIHYVVCEHLLGFWAVFVLTRPDWEKAQSKNVVSMITFCFFTPRSLLEIGYCCLSARKSAHLYVCTSVSMSTKFDLKWYYFFLIITSVVLDDIWSFCKKWFLDHTLFLSIFLI